MTTSTSASGTLARLGIASRVAVSILAVFGLASFLILYVAFWSNQFNAWQNLAVLAVTILLFVGVNGAAWASWGIRYASSAATSP